MNTFIMQGTTTHPSPNSRLCAARTSSSSFIASAVVDNYLDHDHLRRLADGVLDIPESEDRFFTLAKPEGDAVLPLPHWLSNVYVLKWANPTRIGGGAGAAYSLDVHTGEPGRARTRHLYITYMDEAGPSRCRVALAKAIQQLGPILYTAEEDARTSMTVRQVRLGIGNGHHDGSIGWMSSGSHHHHHHSRLSGRDLSMDMDVDMDMGIGPLPVPAAA